MIPTQKYHLEFVLHAPNASLKAIQGSLGEFGENLEITVAEEQQAGDFRVNLDAEEPTLVFDVCSQFGRISSARIEEKGGK